MKPFTAAKGRLAGFLATGPRAELSRAVASRVVTACRAAGAVTAVVSAASEVAAWAHGLELEHIPEPAGGGLDGAAAAAAAEARRRGLSWCIVHADLPFLTAADVRRVVRPLGAGTVVLAPSHNGGTNLLAGSEIIAFSYGPGSFARHLAAARGFHRRVVVTLGTTFDLDTPEDVLWAADLPQGEWLRGFLS